MKAFSVWLLAAGACLAAACSPTPATRTIEQSVTVQMEPGCEYAYDLSVSLDCPVCGASDAVLSRVREAILLRAFGAGFVPDYSDDPDRENPLVGVDDFTEAVKAYVEQRSRDYRRDNAPLWEQVRDLPEQQEALGCQEIISGYFDGAEDGLWRYVLYTEDSLAGEAAGHQTLVLRFQPETGEVLIEEAA